MSLGACSPKTPIFRERAAVTMDWHVVDLKGCRMCVHRCGCAYCSDSRGALCHQLTSIIALPHHCNSCRVRVAGATVSGASTC